MEALVGFMLGAAIAVNFWFILGFVIVFFIVRFLVKSVFDLGQYIGVVNTSFTVSGVILALWLLSLPGAETVLMACFLGFLGWVVVKLIWNEIKDRRI